MFNVIVWSFSSCDKIIIHCFPNYHIYNKIFVQVKLIKPKSNEHKNNRVCFHAQVLFMQLERLDFIEPL